MKMATGLLTPLATQVTGTMNMKAVITGRKPRELRNNLETCTNLLKGNLSLHGASVKDSHCL
jgi:hypothetical protein